MGKILSAKDITNNNIQSFIKESTGEYSAFLASAPTFVVYYSRNSFASTHDESMLNVNQVVGADSPIKFNKILDLPLYAVQTADFGLDITDFGINGTATSSAILLPATIKPAVDDCFVISYQSQERVFTVTDVAFDNINNRKFWKITFSHSQFTVDSIEEQKAKNLVIDFQLLGNQQIQSAVIPYDTFELYKELEAITDFLIDEYATQFEYDASYGVGFRRPDDSILIDSYSMLFLSRNELLSKFDQYRSFRYIGNRPFDKIVSNFEFYNSMFGKLEESPEAVVYTDAANIPLFQSSASRYGMDWLVEANLFVTSPPSIMDGLPPELFEVVNHIPLKVRTKLAETNYTYNAADFTQIERILFKFLKHEISADTVGELFNASMYAYSFPKNLDSYLSIPIVIFILKYLRKRMIEGWV